MRPGVKRYASRRCGDNAPEATVKYWVHCPPTVWLTLRGVLPPPDKVKYMNVGWDVVQGQVCLEGSS